MKTSMIRLLFGAGLLASPWSGPLYAATQTDASGVTFTYEVTSGGASITHVTLPSGVTSVDIPTTLPNGSATIPVTSLAEGLFQSNHTLQAVSLPSGVTELPECLFMDCISLSSVTLPEGLTTIDDLAFSSCTALTSITLPSTVRTLGLGAFSYSGLTSITLPEGLTTIGEAAFDECESLASVSLPSTLTTIEGAAFYRCTALSVITLPKAVTELQDRAFYGCSSLTSVTFLGEPPTMGDAVFEGCASNAVGLYTRSTAWSSAVASGSTWNNLTLQAILDMTLPDSVTSQLSADDLATLKATLQSTVSARATAQGVTLSGLTVQISTAQGGEASEAEAPDIVEECLDLGITPAIVLPESASDANAIATVSFVEPTLKVSAFTPASRQVAFTVVPGNGNTLSGTPNLTTLHLYGTDTLSSSMTRIESPTVDTSAYLTGSTPGALTVTLPESQMKAFLQLREER